MGGARQHRLRLQLHGRIGGNREFDSGFRLGVHRHQIGVDVDGAADLVGEDIAEGVV